MTSRIACFIDGGYLANIFRNFHNPRVDFQKLANWMSESVPILRSYYYYCLPYISDNPSPEESDRFTKAQQFLYSIDSLERFEVRRGKLEFRGHDQNGKPIYVQKRIDMLMAIDFINLCVTHSISDAALLTGDSDFVPAIKLAKDVGVAIHLYHGPENMTHHELKQVCDTRAEITWDVVRQLLLN